MTPTKKDVDSTTSATEILRRMLDERGVEWDASDTYRLLVTSWKDASGHGWTFMEHRDYSFSKLTAYHITPAQAIAATLGAGSASELWTALIRSACGSATIAGIRSIHRKTSVAAAGEKVVDE